jgi:hypothetical protein
MRLVYDRNKIQEGIDAKAYDARNLAICKCGKHRYPSKLMFIRFLEQLSDVKGVADIWSTQDWETGKVKIHIEVEYLLGSLWRISELEAIRSCNIRGGEKVEV